MGDLAGQFITDIDAREFFLGAVEEAMHNQKLQVSGETKVYLGNLLTMFINSERLYDQTQEGMMLKPLASHYLEAVEARSSQERFVVLQRLGDVSLFISGLFAQSLSRSLVDIDYYIAMGGNAYSYLSDREGAGTVIALRIVFSELADNFTEMIDVLSEVGESTSLNTDYDILRLYEIWQKTGSRRVAKKLSKAGIYPIKTASRHH
jgi:hypothetical protein